MSEVQQWPLPEDAPKNPLNGIPVSVEEALKKDEAEYRVIQMARKEQVSKDPQHTGDQIFDVLDIRNRIVPIQVRVKRLLLGMNESVRIAFLLPGFEHLFLAYACTGWSVTRSETLEFSEKTYQGWSFFLHSLVERILLCLGDESTLGRYEMLGQGFLSESTNLSSQDLLLDHSTALNDLSQEDPRSLYMVPRNLMEKRFDDPRWKEILRTDKLSSEKVGQVIEFFRFLLLDFVDYRLETPGARKFYKAGTVLPTDRSEDYLDFFEALYSEDFPQSLIVPRSQEGKMYLTIASSDSRIESVEGFESTLRQLVLEKVGEGAAFVGVKESVPPRE